MSVSQQWVWLHGVWFIAETATCQVTNYCWTSVSQTLSESGQEHLGCTVLHVALNMHLEVMSGCSLAAVSEFL